MSVAYFGEYNGIYFVQGRHGLAEIQDRAHRGRAVVFAEEPLEDLGTEPRVEQARLAGKEFAVHARDPWPMEMPLGYGRGLKYKALASQGQGHSAVRLTVSLPTLTRYRVRWESTSRQGDTFQLGNGITLTVHTSLRWEYRDGIFTVETATDNGDVQFVVDSRVTTTPLHDRIIVALEGHERGAILARAACGRGFVPSFVVTAREWSDPATLPRLLDDLDCSAVIGVGVPVPPDEPRFVQADAATGEWPGAPRPMVRLTAPDLPEAYGPALHLAIRGGARLVLTSTAGTRLRLEDMDGTLLDEWELADLIGVPLPGPDGDGGGELVLCESTPAHLLVCHAVGYADSRARPLAFLPPIGADPAAPAAAPVDAADLARQAARAVPVSLRRPDAATLTVFTRDLPLHLTPVSDGDPGAGRWMDHYTVAHLPGMTGSLLIPRFLRGLLDPAPDVPIGVVFDALQAFAGTEGDTAARRLAEGLGHPLVLSGPRARLEVLREVLQRIDTDLVLVVAHGQDDHFDDHDNAEITSAMISSWRLRGRPLIFNNSCSSWATTGEAFLTAGARAVIGTLWPVDNDRAAAIGARFGALQYGPAETDVPTMLREALRDAGEGGPETAASYVYVGLPGVRLSSTAPIGDDETVQLLTAAFDACFTCVRELLAEEQVAPALTLQHVVTTSLRQRFAALVRPGQMPRHLPRPWAQFTVLDAGCLLDLANLSVGRALLQVLLPAQQRAVVAQMCDVADRVLWALVTWDERHEAHNGYSFTDADRAAQPLPLGALGERGFYDLGAKFAFIDLLPLIDQMVCLRVPELREAALERYELAAKLVTIPDDLEPDGSITDAKLIRRIRAGNPDRLRVLRRDGDGPDELTVDLLAGAVGDKAELANRFGIVRLRLQEYDAAVVFFEAACDLATPGSPVAANAASNLADTRSRRGDQGGGNTGHRAAFELQLASGDLDNALVTAANLLRQAATRTQPLNAAFVDQVLALSDRISPPSRRVALLASVLGALSTYHAGLGDHAGAAAASDRLVPLLQHRQPEPARHLGELAEWYYQHDDLARGAARGRSAARALERAGLAEAAALSYFLAGNAALEAHGGRGPKRLLRLFLECSARLGHVTRTDPAVTAQYRDWLAVTLDNTRRLWSQFADRGRRGLALLAYSAQQGWPDGETDEAWEMLSHAFHPRNIAAVRRLAALGLLRRGAVVKIDTDLRATVAIITVRSPTRQDEPGAVYSTLPLHGVGHPSGTANMHLVSGGAVFRLGAGDSAIVSETGIRAVTRDWRGDLVYRALWGSRLFAYGLTINVAPGLAVQQVRCAAVAGPEPELTVRSGPDGVVVQAAAPRPWLATISVTLTR